MSTVLKNKGVNAQNSSFKKLLFALTFLFGFCFSVSLLAYSFFKSGFLFSVLITSGVTFYHFAMRLAVGYLVDKILSGRVDYNHKWFAPKKFEHDLYKKLKVRKWKEKVPTYDPEQFNIEKHSFDEIIRSMCVAEIVHEIIVIFALLPIFLTIFLGDFWVFFITSVLSAAFDLIFVVLQRYNRPRVMRLLSRKA